MIEHEAPGDAPEAMRWTTLSKEGGSLTVIYHHDDEIADTLGHVGALRTHLILGTLGNAFKRPTPETAHALFERWKDEPWKTHVEVHIGGSPTLDEHVERVFTVIFDRVQKELKEQGRDIRLDPAIFKEHSPINTLIKTAIAYPWLYFRLHRTDHYTPATESAIVYHPNKAIAMHELGHALYYDQTEDKTKSSLLYLLPGFRSHQEWQASANAMKRLDPGQERKDAMKILEPVWGLYVGSDIRAVLMPLVPGVADLTPHLGNILGHLASRLPFRRSSFGQPLETYPSSKTASPV